MTTNTMTLEVLDGTMVRFDAEFTVAEATTTADPTVVLLRVKRPGDDYVEYVYPASPIVRDSAGVYHARVTMDEPGRWWVTWLGEGGTGPIATGEYLVIVRKLVNAAA